MTLDTEPPAAAPAPAADPARGRHDAPGAEAARPRTIHQPAPGVAVPLPSAALTGDATEADMESIRRRTSVYVYEVPVRLWHWVNALAIVVLCVTGYLIAKPLPSMQ